MSRHQAQRTQAYDHNPTIKQAIDQLLEDHSDAIDGGIQNTPWTLESPLPSLALLSQREAFFMENNLNPYTKCTTVQYNVIVKVAIV